MNFIVCTLCARIEATRYAQNRLNSNKEKFANNVRVRNRKKCLINNTTDTQVLKYTLSPAFQQSDMLRSTAGHPRESYIRQAYKKHRLIKKYQISVDKQAKCINYFRNVLG